MNSLDFLMKIYTQQCNPGDYIFLSARKPNFWKDVPIKFKGKSTQGEIQKFLEQYSPQQYDLYFSPQPYSSPRRKKEFATSSKFLAQDIDEYSNPRKLNPPPTYIWESSPNKYQGLWELDRYISESEYTPLNKDLAHHIGCDDCFDYCHVYRIPGTINHKYKNKPSIGLPRFTKQIYKPKTLRGLIGSAGGLKTPTKPSENKNSTQKERKIYAKYNIPKRIRDLLALESTEGLDRSDTIWMIENSLHDLGMTPPEIITLIKGSVFNKYKGRSDEDSRLKGELMKIISGDIEASQSEDKAGSLQLTSYNALMTSKEDFGGWLVKGFWGKNSHGIVAGMPKCFKSTLVQDLIVSVASGAPFLGKYPVLNPGPVLVIQNENADYVMKDRTQKIISHRGLDGKVKIKRNSIHLEFPPDLPISFINQEGFVFNEEYQAQLEKIISELKPVLVVFDPLYLMFEGDLNLGKELNPILNWLLEVKNKFDTSIMLIHHYNKGGTNNTTAKGGARMMGSIFLYGWIESAWYLTREITDTTSEEIDSQSDECAHITLSREFRMAGQFPDIDISFEMGEIGDPYYEVTVELAGQASNNRPQNLQEAIINLLSSRNTPISRRRLAEELGATREKLREALDALLEDKRIIAKGEGFIIYKGK